MAIFDKLPLSFRERLLQETKVLLKAAMILPWLAANNYIYQGYI